MSGEFYTSIGRALWRSLCWLSQIEIIDLSQPLPTLPTPIPSSPVQLKELQQALDAHPARNRLTALQISLQNTFDLLKYALTLAAATPAQFKWTALVSWLAVLGGAASYAVYLRGVRGHLVHLDWIRKGR